jgi:phenylacetate-CoA ligase
LVFENLYLHMPAFCQNVMCSLYGAWLNHRRYGNTYETLERKVFEREQWVPELIKSFTHWRCQAIVKHAASTVPYYRRLFAEMHINPQDIRKPEDLKVLPIIRKELVQQNLTDFQSESKSRMRYSLTNTSGTTGAGLVFPITLEAEQEQWAVWWRYRFRFVLGRNTWYAHFYGKSVVPFERSKPPFWRINSPGRQILFSAYHISEHNIPYYIEELNRRQPPWIQGYPSILALLASFMLDSGLELDYKPRIITIGAENLLTQQKLIIQKAFGTVCRQHYGLAECVANISECPEGNLHVDEDFAHVEFLPIEGNLYRIIGTNYTNYAFPLIRYDTGDLAELEDPDKRCPCGRSGRLVRSIDGRKEDYVLTPDGRRIGRLDHIFKNMVNIRECQIFQQNVERVIFRLVRSKDYTEKDEKVLLHEAQIRLGNQIKIDIDYVEAIERTKLGKLRFVISNIPDAQIQNIKGNTVETIDSTTKVR